MKTQKKTITELAIDGLPMNLHNPAQGDAKRVLCVCAGGLLRSPTAARLLANEPYNCNTRSAGIIPEWSLIGVDKRLIEWADEIVCFESEHAVTLASMTTKPVHCLNIDDYYGYRNPELEDLITQRLRQIGFSYR